MPKHSSKKDCRQKCGERCYRSVKCHTECPEITAEKNLLNLSTVTDGYISGPDVSATYEIVISNKSHNKVTCLSIIDSFFGLYPNVDGPSGLFGGELRPHYTNISVETGCNTVIPNSYDQMVAAGGELLAPGSYMLPFSVCSVFVRITGRGFFLSNDPSQPGPTGQNIDNGVGKYSMSLQNTSIIRGTICKKLSCGCHCTAPIFPIYVKSGIQNPVTGTLFSFLPTNLNPT